MFPTSKALTSKVQSILSKVIFSRFSQANKGSINNLPNPNANLTPENPKSSPSSMAQNVSFGITYAKHISEIVQEASMDTTLKRIQKTATNVHCFNPRSHHEEDVPIRIFRTHYTVAFMPSVQFLEKEFSIQKKG